MNRLTSRLLSLTVSLAGAAFALLPVAGQAATINLTPASPGMIGLNLGPANCEPGCIYTAFGIPNMPALTLLYKSDVTDIGGSVDSGSFAGSYDTTFANTPNSPMDAFIDYIGGASIDCPECYLAIKDGNQQPSYYFYNLAGWNGTDDLNLTGFWPGQGAISHVAIWGRDGGGPPNETPEPMSLALVGLALAAAGLARRRRTH